MNQQAGFYNKVKAIVFSILNTKGELKAYQMLDKYKKSLYLPSWYGLKAELDFYSKYKNKYVLDPIWDYGIKADFTGNIDGLNNCRIDVTTNIGYKKLQNYTPIQDRDNRKYKIVVMNIDTGLIDDIFDLNFPISHTSNGRIFEIALFIPPSFDKDGNCKNDSYQKIVSIDSSYPDSEYSLKCISTDWYIPDFDTLISEFPEDESLDFNKAITEHAVTAVKALDNSTNSNIVACGQSYYEIIDPRDGDGEWVTKSYWKHPVISDYLDEIIDSDISSDV